MKTLLDAVNSHRWNNGWKTDGHFRYARRFHGAKDTFDRYGKRTNSGHIMHRQRQDVVQFADDAKLAADKLLTKSARRRLLKAARKFYQ